MPSSNELEFHSMPDSMIAYFYPNPDPSWDNLLIYRHPIVYQEKICSYPVVVAPTPTSPGVKLALWNPPFQPSDEK